MDYIGRIKKIKSERKITNERLSELTGIPLGTLSKIMAGISDSPKLSNMVLIASALGCSLDYIVSGTPENTHNYTLSPDEITLMENYRQLDSYGRDLLHMISVKELDRIGVETEATRRTQSAEAHITDDLVAQDDYRQNEQKHTRILSMPTTETPDSASVKRKNVLLYDLPVSAGPGVYLDDSTATEIFIPDNERTASTKYALRVSGNSMEPKYHDGDVLLIEEAKNVDVGELGIFILDGNGYFKRFGGDRLISINPEYDDIMLRDYVESVCCGRVVGRLKKK